MTLSLPALREALVKHFSPEMDGAFGAALAIHQGGEIPDRLDVSTVGAVLVQAMLPAAPERGTASAAKFWGLLSQNGGQLTQAEGTFRALLKQGDDAKATAYLKGLDKPSRDYVLSQVFSQGDAAKMNPLARARDANGVIGDLRRDLAKGGVLGRSGQPIQLSATQLRDGDKALAQLQMVEMHNGLKAAEVPGWHQQAFMTRKDALQALYQAAPPLKDVLTLRMAAAKVPPADAASRVWSVLKQRLEGLDSPSLSRLMARERYQSPTTKLSEALRLRGGLDRFNAMRPGPAVRTASGNAFAQ